MLHPVTDSAAAPLMRRVFNLQTRLVEALCALAEGTQVELPWLQGVWSGLETDWVRRFWENDKGVRGKAVQTVAGASTAAKDELLALMREEHSFAGLYAAQATCRMTKVDWKATPAKEAMHALMVSFYAPCLYAQFKYRLADGDGRREFDKDEFIASFPDLNICPYCDTLLQTDELDHFLPKDSFPFLTCHPDNLFPSCHDSNRVGHKGSEVPLDWDQADQSAAYFHPKWRPGLNALRVTFVESADRRLSVELHAKTDEDEVRVTNMNRLFKLEQFWSRHVGSTYRGLAEDVEAHLRRDNKDPDTETVRKCLLVHHDLVKIGRDALAVPQRALYEHVTSCAFLIDEIVNQCKESRAAYGGNP